MTRKDYQAIAEAIKNSIMSDDNVISINNLIYELDKVFLEDNQGFDLDKFIGACNLEYNLRDKNYQSVK